MLIAAKELGKGYGDLLMKEFLSSSFAQKADLIFLDPNPGEGLFEGSKEYDTAIIAKLMRFYRKYRFRNNPKSNRMWLVRKGSSSDTNLPT